MLESQNLAHDDGDRIALNPHLEPHGHRAIEWSYHFSLRGNDAICAEIDIALPGEKAPASGRESLLNAAIAHTRFSLAVAATNVEGLSTQFHHDSLWIRDQLCRHGGRDCLLADLQKSPVLLRLSRDYFKMGFLSRLTLMLQSSLKRTTKEYCLSLCELEKISNLQFEDGVRESLGRLEGSLRSVWQTIEAAQAWRQLLKMERSHPDFDASSPPSQLARLCSELDEISELLLGLLGKSLADAQDASFDATEGSFSLDSGQGRSETIELALGKFSEWAASLRLLRAEFGLASVADLRKDPELAARFFERSLEIKRTQYRKWDLSVELKPADRRVDFWIGAVAAGVAALFAFFATLVIALWFPGSGGLSATQTGIIAISLFAFANAIIYIIKDRMKELLKIYVRRYLRVRGGRWKGVCKFLPPSFELETEGHSEVTAILGLERRLWWTKVGEDWHFKVREIFSPLALSAQIPSTTIKQLWRIPFDEILDTFDDSTHVLRLPAEEGRPYHVKTLKRVTLPFTSRVRALAYAGKQERVISEELMQGTVVVSGSQIVAVEKLSDRVMVNTG